MPKISELPSTSAPTTADSLPIVQGSVTKKTTLNDLPIPATVQTALDTKAPVANPTFTGTTTAPNVSVGALTVTGALVLSGDQIQVGEGGTGATTAASARTNLGATSIGSTIFTAANANAVQTAIATSGTVLQEVVYTDAGSSTTLPTLTNITTSVKNITPKSSNSTIVVTVTFAGSVLTAGAGTNATGLYQLYNNTTASNIGGAYTLGVLNGSGSNLTTNAMGIVSTIVTNAGLSTIGFTLRAAYSTAATTVSGTSQVWTIREIQN